MRWRKQNSLALFGVEIDTRYLYLKNVRVSNLKKELETYKYEQLPVHNNKAFVPSKLGR